MKAIIYGASGGGAKAYQVWRKFYDIVAFVDNDESKWGQELYGIKIHKPSAELLQENFVIIGTSFKEIEVECQQAGISILPYHCTRYLYQLEGEQAGGDIPFVELSEQEIEGCRLLTNRIEMLKKLKKGGCVAEVGTFRGNFAKEILTICRPSKLYLIDLWERYSNYSNYEQVQSLFADEISKGIVELIRSDSVQALQNMKDASLDWVYLDTCHNYSVPKAELQAAQKKVVKGGMICGHDYTNRAYSDGTRYGVKEAVNEFCVENGWHMKYLTCELSGHDSYALEVRYLKERAK